VGFEAPFKNEVNELVYDTQIGFDRLTSNPEMRDIMAQWDLNSILNRESTTNFNQIIRNTNNSTNAFLNNTDNEKFALRIWAKLTAFRESTDTLAKFLGHDGVQIPESSDTIDVWILDDTNGTIYATRLENILDEIYRIQGYLVHIFGGQNEQVLIVYLESGSRVKARIAVLKITASFLIGASAIYFQYVRFGSEMRTEQRSNAALAELAVVQRLSEMKKEHQINDSVADKLTNRLINSLVSLAGASVEVQDFRPTTQLQLLTPRRPMLELNPPPRIEVDVTDVEKNSEPEKANP